MPFSHLCRSHTRISRICQHHEQVSIKRPTNTLTDILNVSKKVLQIQIYLERRLNTLAATVNKGDTARQTLNISVFHRVWHLKRWLCLVINDLSLTQLLMLQLLDVAESLHTRGIAVNVATDNAPARTHHWKVLVSTLSQKFPVISTNLKVTTAKRHVLRILLRRIPVLTRLNCMNNRYPLIQTASVIQIPDRMRAILVTKFLNEFGNRLVKLSVQSANHSLIVRRNAVLSNSHRVMVNDILKVGQHNTDSRSERSQFLIHLMQRPVGVRLLKNRLHPLRHRVQPQLHWRKCIQIRISSP